MTATNLFRARYAFVCDRCDLGYRGGRLAGFGPARNLICARCLIGHDPDAPVVCTNTAHTRRNDDGNCLICNPPTPTGQEIPCETTVPTEPTLFD